LPPTSLADPVMIKWLLDKAKLNDPQKIKIVISLALQLNKLKQEYNSAGISLKQKLKPQIHAIESRLTKLRSNMVHYVEVSAYDVLYAYGERWLKDKQRNMKKREFEVSIENKNPDKPGDSFYPNFDQALHTYDIDYDIDPGKAFIFCADYQHSLSPILISQLHKLPGRDKPSVNFVDEVYTLANPSNPPDDNLNGQQGGLTDAVQLFCNRYKGHIRKTVYYIYNHTAVGKRNDADRYSDIVIKTLKKNGWQVIEVYTGHTPAHALKYFDIQDWLQCKNATDYPIAINRKRCPSLVISITGAPAKTKNGKTEKDKSSEQEPSLDQSKTTHFSDVFDDTLHAVNKLKLISISIEAKKAATK
jgi:hypothetical protein